MEIEKFGYFRVARDAAEKSLHPEFRVGAVVCNRKPLGFGWNQYTKTNPNIIPEKGRKRALHAEMHATLGLSERELQGSSVYVVRLTPGGKYGLALPCNLCQKFLLDRGVRKVYYSTADGFEMMRLR